jgi:hypothetical protein
MRPDGPAQAVTAIFAQARRNRLISVTYRRKIERITARSRKRAEAR